MASGRKKSGSLRALSRKAAVCQRPAEQCGNRVSFLSFVSWFLPSLEWLVLRLSRRGKISLEPNGFPLVRVGAKALQSCPALCTPHGLKPARLLCPWDFPGKKTSRLPFPTARDLPNPEMEPASLVSCTGRQVLYHWCHVGIPIWRAVVSLVTGSFTKEWEPTGWTQRDFQEYPQRGLRSGSVRFCLNTL